MKVKTFLDSLSGKEDRFIECMERITEIWSNDACKGYAIVAMRSAGLNPREIRKVVIRLERVFDEMSISEAEQTAYKF